MSTRRISDDPGGWSDDRLEAHAREWLGLPLLECKQVMGDYDAEAHGDLLYVSDLVDDLCSARAELEAEAKEGSVEARTWLMYLLHGAESLPVTPKLALDWPVDRAGVLLDAWRNEGEAAA